MFRNLLISLLALCVVSILAACQHDEPGNPIKPVEERRVLVLTSEGEIFDQTGELVKQLPNCTYASEIIADGDDYFVAGVQSKGRVGYWKNGKWNTLHVDFIEDVDHWTYGIGKWDYYIYLLDMPNVLKNSGIFPLEDSHEFFPASHGLRVSEGKCYVVGYALSDEDAQCKPVLYTNYKKEYLPMPEDAKVGECHAIYAYDRDHTVIGGIIDRRPAVWIDKEYQIYETLCPEPEVVDDVHIFGRIEAITMCNGHVFAAGLELNEEQALVATVWTDGVPAHYTSGRSGSFNSMAKEIYSYGDDVYVLTSEYDKVNDEYVTFLWMNGKILNSYPGKEASGFTVL